MSDKDELNKVVDEYRKAKKHLDDKLIEAIENSQQSRQELEAQSTRPT